MNEDILKELRQIRYSIRGGVYFISALLIALILWK